MPEIPDKVQLGKPYPLRQSIRERLGGTNEQPTDEVSTATLAAAFTRRP
ncbi:MAG: hypothetical protein ACLQMH_13535 [Solirubrobacteraceae bacterium]